ncbi:MAG: hypothetical protein ACOYOO_09950 [Saprospiraceae bacterium]
MKNKVVYTLGILFVLGSGSAQAQIKSQADGSAWLTEFSYGAHLPGGDMAKRFGPGFGIGTAVQRLSEKGNLMYGVQGQFLFGSDVREDVLSGLRTKEGYIIGNDRNPADIQLRKRGRYLGVQAGKLWSVSPTNPRSGIRTSLGAGILQHRIRIQEDPLRAVQQVQGDYAQGYDRYASGPCIYQWIGYQVFSKDGKINLYLGFEGFQAFTRGRRDVQFDLQGPYLEKRLDLLWGIRAGWVVPLYSGKGRTIWY